MGMINIKTEPIKYKRTKAKEYFEKCEENIEKYKDYGIALYYNWSELFYFEELLRKYLNKIEI